MCWTDVAAKHDAPGTSVACLTAAGSDLRRVAYRVSIHPLGRGRSCVSTLPNEIRCAPSCGTASTMGRPARCRLRMGRWRQRQGCRGPAGSRSAPVSGQSPSNRSYRCANGSNPCLDLQGPEYPQSPRRPHHSRTLHPRRAASGRPRRRPHPHRHRRSRPPLRRLRTPRRNQPLALVGAGRRARGVTAVGWSALGSGPHRATRLHGGLRCPGCRQSMPQRLVSNW